MEPMLPCASQSKPTSEILMFVNKNHVSQLMALLNPELPLTYTGRTFLTRASESIRFQKNICQYWGHFQVRLQYDKNLSISLNLVDFVCPVWHEWQLQTNFSQSCVYLTSNKYMFLMMIHSFYYVLKKYVQPTWSLVNP